MVIAISAIEQAAVEIAAVEPPQREPDENDEEIGAFARILAGMMQKNEAAEVSLESEAVDGISQEIELELLAGDLIDTVELPEDQFGSLISAEYLLSRTVNEETETGESSLEAGFFAEDTLGLEDSDLLAGDKTGDLLQKIKEQLNSQKTNNPDSMDEAAVAETKSALQPEEITDGKNQKKNTLNDRETQKADTSLSSRNNEELAASRNNELRPNRQEKTRLEEVRDIRRGRDRFSLEVHDFRTNENAAKSAETFTFAGTQTRLNGGGSAQEITMELRLPDIFSNTGQSQASAQTNWEVSSSNALENMLARELHQNFNGDIVRHASMALRDGGEGTIRLALKPEWLGNVKIHLEMAENKITGKIIVESEEALRAFEKEIQSLEQAFRDSGYADASLNLSLTAGGRGGGQEAFSFPPHAAASLYDDSFELSNVSMVDVFVKQGSHSVNVLV